VLSQSVDGALLDEVRGRIGALIEKVHLGHLHPEPAIGKAARPATIAGYAGSTETSLPLAKNTVVRASAGTGKTYKLVSTWVDLVESGSDPLRIVAVTFTEKAAADMRSRIREAIVERMRIWLRPSMANGHVC
jgi:hypothetical protein